MVEEKKTKEEETATKEVPPPLCDYCGRELDLDTGYFTLLLSQERVTKKEKEPMLEVLNQAMLSKWCSIRCMLNEFIFKG